MALSAIHPSHGSINAFGECPSKLYIIMAASCLVGGGIKICGAENVANLEEKASLSDNSTRNETMKLTFLRLIPK